MRMKLPLHLFGSKKSSTNATNGADTTTLQPPSNSPVTVGFWKWSKTTDETVFSDSLYAILDLDPTDNNITEATFLQSVHPTDKQRVLDVFQSIREHRMDSHEFEARVITRSDQIKFLSTRVDATFDNEGGFESVSAVVEDITAYRHAVSQWSFTKRAFESFVANSSDAIVFLDTKLRVTHINPGAERLFGWSTDECTGLRLPMVPASEQIRVLRLMNEIFVTKTAPSYETQRQCKNGRLVDVSVTITLMTDDYNEPVGLTVIYRDIGERITLNQQLLKNERRLDDLTLHSVNVTVTLNPQQIIEYVSPSVQNVLGYLPDALLNMDFYSLVHPEDTATYTKLIADSKVADNGTPIELRLRHISGQWRLFSLTVDSRRDDFERVTELVFNFHDITEEKRLREYATRQTTHDSVTGLANPQFLENYIEQLCMKENAPEFAFLYLEIRDFRPLLGGLETHSVNEFMCAIADRIRHTVPANAVVGRISDIHFGVVIPFCNSLYIEQLAERMIEAFNRMFNLETHQVLIPCTIGICLRKDGHLSPKTMWRNASYALTMVSHQQTRKKYFLYNSSMDILSFKYHHLSEDLSFAIENEQFEVYYQPRVNGSTGEILGAEALIRWNHPKWGVVLPGEFIAQAEATGLIDQIGEWVLKTACQQMAEWHRAGYPGLIISVNFSPRQFLERDIETMISQTLVSSNLNPAFLEIEVTENGYSDIPSIATTLANLKSRLGVRIAIDDFGTGEASLLVLRELDPDVIKLDKELIKDISYNPRSLSIVHAVQEMARALNYTIIVEGVERQSQVEDLLQQKCLYMQGYYFSEPLPASSFTQSLTLRRIHSPSTKTRNKKEWVSRSFRVSFPNPLSGRITLHSVGGQLVELGYSPIFILNIGTGGLCFDSSIRFAGANELRLKFFVQLAGHEFQLLGRIVWTNETSGGQYRYGVEFSDFTRIEELTSALDQIDALLTIDDTPPGYDWVIEDDTAH